LFTLPPPPRPPPPHTHTCTPLAFSCVAVLLEVSFDALADAGFDPLDMASSGLATGVFLSGGSLPHLDDAMAARLAKVGGAQPQLEAEAAEVEAVATLERDGGTNLDGMRRVDPSGYFALEIGHDKDYVATAVAYALDLTGPAESVHAACSSSLVAIARGVHAIRLGLCDGEPAQTPKSCPPQHVHTCGVDSSA